MADRQVEFSYRNIELYKSDSLGSGAYGGVCKAKCDGLLCAAKIMHPTLFDLRDPGTPSYLRKFSEECQILSLARHPHVVQYLATSQDPDTQLPVLLMELCDESLTAFLEHSPGPLPYHIQISTCHDIALALVYLHSNGLIHRDLTGNNVLMMAGPRAKITDFGMSKLVHENPVTTALTLCPGNLLYMSPEALDEAKSYTAKLDIFSFGVIVIQILTRQFPSPTECFRTVQGLNNKEASDEEDEVCQLVPETERRRVHLQMIPDHHSLKPVVLQCLKRERRRPSALELSHTLFQLKQAPQYTVSLGEAQNISDDIQQLQLQLQGQRVLTEAKAREVMEHQAQITELETALRENDRQFQDQLQTKDRELQAKDRQLEAMDRELQAKDRQLQAMDKELQAKDWELQTQTRALHEKDRQLQLEVAGRETQYKELQLMRKQLCSGEDLVSQSQLKQQRKEKATFILQETVAAQQQQLEQQDIDQSEQEQPIAGA